MVVCVCVGGCTPVVAVVLSDSVHMQLAEVPGTEEDAGRMQQQAAQPP